MFVFYIVRFIIVRYIIGDYCWCERVFLCWFNYRVIWYDGVWFNLDGVKCLLVYLLLFRR